MKKPDIAILVATMALAAAGMVSASEHHKDLPPGPIQDRHELMEQIGDNAKIVGDALKTNDLTPLAGAARQILTDSTKILPLFPKGSTHANSRAKDEIWTDWPKFESASKEFEAKAGDLVAAASTGGDIDAAAKAMFGTCKSCHDQFRKPEEKR
jgi:cytochrome c556